MRRNMGEFKLRVGVLALILGISGLLAPRAANAQGQPGSVYLAQLGQAAQSAANQKAQTVCYDTCNKRCDADYKTCSLNGKAPQLVVNSTCSPRMSECNAKCTASCAK